MAKQYREESNANIENKISELCALLPPKISEFNDSISFSTTPKTRLEYIKDLKTFMEYVVGTENLDTPLNITLTILEDFNRRYFERYLTYLRRYEKDGKIYTNDNAAVKRKLASLRRFYKYLYNNDDIEKCNILKVENVTIKDKEIVKMDARESNQFLNKVKSGTGTSDHASKYHEKLKTRDLAIIYLMLSSGIRVSECVGIDMEDVNFETSSVKVIRKGGKEETVYFSDEAAGYLMEYYEERKQIKTDKKYEHALFLSTQKKRIGVRTVEIMVKKYGSAVGLSSISPHKLRSTFATNLYRQSGDIKLVADKLGHSDINVTSSYYAEGRDLAESRNAVQYD